LIVSITPEIGIDEIPIYAGGLGVLEGDKFIEASEKGLEYVVITLFYRKGYVYYNFDPEKGLVEEARDFSEYEEKLSREDPFKIYFDNKEIIITPLVFIRNKAKIVYLKISAPEDFEEKLSRLYMEDDKYWFEAKYIILAKASYEYIDKRIGFENISTIDMQESLASLISILLPHTFRKRLVIHTPGPWGHPKISREVLARELGYTGGEEIITKISSSRVDKIFAVSEKHYEITRATFPEFDIKLSYVTNGVSLRRWMNEEIKNIYRDERIDPSEYLEAHNKIKKRLLELARSYKKDLDIKDHVFIASWARRVTRYKRPYFMIRLIEDLADKMNILFILGGKAHPRDEEGVGYMKIFYELHREYPNVVYIYDYDVEKAKTILAGSDLLLFTPFPGWEASGTSFMKAGVNGVPTLASRDGAAVEMISDGFNGWLFGSDIRYPIDLYSNTASEIDQRDYVSLYDSFKKIIDVYENNFDYYLEIMINTLKTFSKDADINRVLRQYYPEYFRENQL